MFGYIKPYVPELRVKEHECWRAVYCGLCKCMGRHICADSTLALSYDAAFLALARLAATGEETKFANRRCAVHIAKKSPMLEPCEALRYSASVCALLAYHKLADDIADEGRLSRRLLLPEAKRLRRKAGLAGLDSEITGLLDKLHIAEKSSTAEKSPSAEKSAGRESGSVDMFAELSGGITAAVFANGLDGRASRVAAELGRRVGRWIYIADAVADRGKDAKSGAFNPFSGGYEQESVAASLTLERRAAESALNLLDCADPGIESILRNILTLGMSAVEEKILRTSNSDPNEMPTAGNLK